MDIIDSAVSMGRNVSKIQGLDQQTWEKFDILREGKKVFLFGAGPCAGIYFDHYKEQEIPLDGVVDNDSEKWGVQIDDVVYKAVPSGKGDIRISSVDVLKRYPADKVVVLIANTKHYEEMISQLEAMGGYSYFVLLMMEVNWRKQQQYEERAMVPELFSRRNAFIEECCKKKIMERKIVFYSFGTYSDHGKYISEQLQKLRSDLDIVWLMMEKMEELPDGVRCVSVKNWAKYIYEMETAKVWVFNIEVPDYIVKRPEQIFVQAKHWASVTLKKCYLDAVTLRESPSYENWKRNGKMFDYMLTGSDFDTEFCRRAFGFGGECIQIGSPRSDSIFRGEENRRKVGQYYGITSEVHIAMYAPTFRFRGEGCWHHRAPEMELDFGLLRAALQEKWKGEWCIFLRLHPNVAKESKELKLPDYVTDASSYSDSQELASAADVVISDYSSIMFEPAFANKPVFLFATDRVSYIDKEYNLAIEYNTLPFPFAESNQQLLQCIREFDEEKYKARLGKFMQKYGVREDGHASERAAAFLSKLIS